VQVVLGERPDEDASNKPERNVGPENAGRPEHDPAVEHIQAERRPDQYHHGRVDVGKELQEIGLKKADRDIAVIDFDLFIHQTPPGNRKTVKIRYILSDLYQL
jgi:hypothetical protein